MMSMGTWVAELMYAVRKANPSKLDLADMDYKENIKERKD